MSSLAEPFLDAAKSAATLLAEPAVAAAWQNPSALVDFHVSGLAGHLGSQVILVVEVLDRPVPADAETVALADHYTRVRWRGAEPDAEFASYYAVLLDSQRSA